MYSGFFQTNFLFLNMLFIFPNLRRGRENKKPLQKQKFEFFNLKFLKIIFFFFSNIGMNTNVWSQTRISSLPSCERTCHWSTVRYHQTYGVPACRIAGATNDSLPVGPALASPSCIVWKSRLQHSPKIFPDGKNARNCPENRAEIVQESRGQFHGSLAWMFNTLRFRSLNIWRSTTCSFWFRPAPCGPDQTETITTD